MKLNAKQKQIRRIPGLRTVRMQGKYANFILSKKDEKGKTFFSKPGIKEWKYWKLLKNDFPYNKIAAKHDLLVPKREFAFDEQMQHRERGELFFIKSFLADQYDCFIENSVSNRTYKGHYHLHCIRYKI